MDDEFKATIIGNLKALVHPDAWKCLGCDEDEAVTAAMNAAVSGNFWETVATIFIGKQESDTTNCTKDDE